MSVELEPGALWQCGDEELIAEITANEHTVARWIHARWRSWGRRRTAG
jgi:hypothetical protein